MDKVLNLEKEIEADIKQIRGMIANG